MHQTLVLGFIPESLANTIVENHASELIVLFIIMLSARNKDPWQNHVSNVRKMAHVPLQGYAKVVEL